MAIEFLGRRVCVFERRARKLELSPRLERNGAAALRVIEADQIASVLDPFPAKPVAHALEQRANSPFPVVKDGRTVGAIERYLLVLGADPKWTRRLAPCLEPGDERVARLDNLTIDDVASHAGAHPSGRRTGEPALDSRSPATLQRTGVRYDVFASRRSIAPAGREPARSPPSIPFANRAVAA